MHYQKGSRTVVLIIVLLLFAMVLSACGSSDKEKSYTVGAVISDPTVVESWDFFKAAMTEKGYVEGENIAYVDEQSVNQLLEQVSASDLDLVFAVGGSFGQDSMNSLIWHEAVIDHDIPIILAPSLGDPMASGDVESLSHPGKHFTGLLVESTDAKRFELFAKMLPDDAGRVAVIYDPDNADALAQLPQIEYVGEQTDLDLLLLATPLDDPAATEQALTTLPGNVDGVFLLKIWGTSIEWFHWAYTQGVPTSQDTYLQAPVAQPLMSYGPSMLEVGEAVARLADQVFKGASPGDLPFEFPDSYLVIDLALSEAIGFDVPDEMLRLADEIRRSDMSVYANTSPPVVGEIIHPSGTGACAANLIAMGMPFTVCVTTTCDALVDVEVMIYPEKTDVAECSSQNQVGTCSTPAFDTHYYDGDANAIAIGCGFMLGEWTAAG